jgi:hypothetical protein
MNDEDPDDRTRRLAELAGVKGSRAPLRSRRIVVELSPDVAGCDTARLAFLTVCNLATRLGTYLPSLDVAVPADIPAFKSRVYPEGTTLRDQALWVLHSATRTEHLSRGKCDEQRYDLSIIVGGQTTTNASEHIFVGWEGWTGIVGTEPTPLSEPNRIGALVGAAMAVAWLHADQLRILGGSIPARASVWRLNALTLDDGSASCDLPERILSPETLLVGAGALGSTLTYLLTHIAQLEVTVTAVDYDVLKLTNANRQVTAPFRRADGVTLKVQDLAEACAAIRPIPARYEELKDRGERTAEGYAIAITAVDSARVRREVAQDLPKVLIDGATGGLTVFLMRGDDPNVSCVACRYAEVTTDDETFWATRLGISRAEVKKLKESDVGFSDDVLRSIEEKGTYPWDEEVEAGLRTEGWRYLERHACGDAKPERDLPAASVSYVSALCGFLMGAQYIAELLGRPALMAPSSTWTWNDVLREPPSQSVREPSWCSPGCAARHDRRSRHYQRAWSHQLAIPNGGTMLPES